ncbi:MAG: tRNA 4-thiouridine(8) synthase ThiI, partial [Erysipelotrichales bacterium]|nr:tRNA 4-thiouridine(8) synthase ThiI [Erysipelotrichales bacterium]
DKLEIIAKAREIGTYETSILPFEDCCTIFTPKDPVTKPRSERCEEYEKRFDWKPLLDQAVADTETVTESDEE